MRTRRDYELGILLTAWSVLAGAALGEPVTVVCATEQQAQEVYDAAARLAADLRLPERP